MPLLFENKPEKDISLIKDWVRVRTYVHNILGKKPDIQSIIFLIGVNELGEVRYFEKEEKQDLMHIGMCVLLEGIYYKYQERDSDGWPHYIEVKAIPPMFIKMQEEYLKERIIQYFNQRIFI